MKRRIGSSVAAMAVALSVAAGAANAVVCANGAEKESFQVRALQTRLMVAALTCDARDRYNAFVVRYRPSLKGHGRNLTGFFHRAFGPASLSRLDRYVTDLANQASALSTADRPGFCARSSEILGDLLDPATATNTGLGSISQTLPLLPEAAPQAPICEALSRR